MLGSHTIETPVGTPLAYAIENIQSWLAARKIEPLYLKSCSDQHITFLDIRFRSQPRRVFLSVISD